jgi:hypothetical protein
MAISRGLTLDQLGLESADEIRVPTSGGFERTMRIIAAALALPLAIFTVVRLSR